MMRLALSFGHFVFDIWNAEDSKVHGLLFRIPEAVEHVDNAELFDELAYSGSVGWHTCKSGYAILVVNVSPHEFVVIPGLNVPLHCSVEKQIVHTMAVFTAEEVESHVAMALHLNSQNTEALHKELRSYVHEIKKINSEIYNQSFGLVSFLGSSQELSKFQPNAISIMEHSGLLKIRTDFMQFIANPELDMPETTIDAYESVKRITDMFAQTRPSKKVLITERSDFDVFGPNFFDLVSFIALENAYKYSPTGDLVRVTFNMGTYINTIKITNLGPKIEKDEHTKILEGYRGRNAELAVADGEGIGLPTLKRIVENYYNGKIILSQDESSQQLIGGVEYMTTTCRLQFPANI